MQHEVALAPRMAWHTAVPPGWRVPLVQLGCVWAGLLALAAGDWAEMARQWWNASTYNHILLIVPILAWLVRQRWPELVRLTPQAWWPPLAWLGGGALLWAGGDAAGVNLIAQLGAVVMLQGTLAAVLGPRVTMGLLFPLSYLLFLVPFGDEIVPELQTVTARLAIALTHVSGVPAQLNGVFIDTPVGLFEVAEACSGVKFLVAMLALGTLAAHFGFRSWRRRAAFIAASVVVPVIANGVRAWGTIYIAQSQGVAFAAGFDHIFYGWIFFALVMAGLLGVAWQFFDRSPHDPLVDVATIEASPTLARLSRQALPGWAAVLAALGIAVSAAVLATIAAPSAQALLAAARAHP